MESIYLCYLTLIFIPFWQFSMCFTLCYPTLCLFQHQMSLPVHVGLDRFHCAYMYISIIYAVTGRTIEQCVVKEYWWSFFFIAVFVFLSYIIYHNVWSTKSGEIGSRNVFFFMYLLTNWTLHVNNCDVNTFTCVPIQVFHLVFSLCWYMHLCHSSFWLMSQVVRSLVSTGTLKHGLWCTVQVL